MIPEEKILEKKLCFPAGLGLVGVANLLRVMFS
jgi:hypothetical protein